MRVPPTEDRVITTAPQDRLARAGQEALAGAAVTIVGVLAASLILSTVIFALEVGAALVVIGAILWFFVFRRRR
jgi:uncharacterized membrane protein